MKQSADSVMVECGGIIDETSVTLAIYGDDLEPDEISKLLGFEPTSAHRKGEQKGPRSPVFNSGAWLFEIRGLAPLEPEELTASLLDRIPSSEAFWKPISSRFEIQLRYGIHLESWNRGFSLSHNLIQRIQQIQARIDFDIYSYLEDEPA